MRRWWRRIAVALWWSTATLVIAAAVLLGLARLLLPGLGGYRSDVQVWLSDYLHRPVSVERLDLRWVGYGPQLMLGGVRITDPAGEATLFEVREGFVDADLMALLLGGAGVIRDIELVGLSLELERRADGSIALQGMELQGPGGAGTGGAGELLAMFAQARSISLSKVSMAVHDWRSGARYRLQNVSLRLFNDEDRHLAGADVPLPAALGEAVRVRLELTGGLLEPDRQHGRLFVSLAGVRPAVWQAWWPAAPLAVSTGVVDGELWLDWSAGGPRSVSARLAARELTVEAGGGASWRAAALGGRLRWQRADDGWSAQLEDLTLDTEARPWPASRAQLRFAADADGGRLDGEWSYLDLAEAQRLLQLAEAAGLRSAASSTVLRQLQPRGVLRDVRFQVPLGAPAATALAARFEHLAARPWTGVPGFEGLSGSVAMQAGAGRIDLDSHALQLEFPGLFRDPLHAETLAGSLGFAVTEGVDVWSPHLLIANADLHSESRLSARWRSGEALFLDLQSDFRDGDARATSRYLPTGIMPEPLVRWLDASIRDGRVIGGTALVYGATDRFPFRGNDGVFQVDFRVADVQLDYQADWPPAEGVGAHVRFAQAGLDIDAQTATLLGARVEQARVRFADLADGLMELTGTVAARVPQSLRFVRESPLRERFGAFFGAARGDGESRVSLRLELPVAHVDDYRIAGDVLLQRASLRNRAWGLELDDLHGTVAFDREGLSIEALDGRLNGRAVRISASPHAGGARLLLDGALEARELLAVHVPALSGFFSGWAAAQVQVDLPPRPGAPVQVRATSELLGTTVALPAPLDKPANRTLPFTLELGLGEEALRVAFSYGELLHARLDFARGAGGALRLTRGVVSGGGAASPPGPGLRVAVDTGPLDLDGWLQLARMLPEDAASPDATLRYVALRAGEATFNRRPIGALSVTGFRTAAGWTVNIDNPGLRGSLDVPVPAGPRRPVRVALEHLNLDLLQATGATAGADSATDTPELAPDALPPLHIDVAQLSWGSIRIADLRVRTAPHGRRLTLDELAFENGDLSVHALGEWQLGADGNHRARLEFRLDSEDWGQGLSAIGYPRTLRGGRGYLAGELSWMGTLYRPQLRHMNGSLRVNIRDGSLLDADPGVGRLVGLFSIQALPRRLALDFADFLDEGFQFDTLEGSVELVGGVAYTREMVMTGTVGRVEVSGSSDLAAQTFAQQVVVTPNLSASLPVVGELAVPGSGLAVLVLGSLLKGLGLDIGKVGELKYTLSGPWSDPVLEQQRPARAEPPERSPIR